MSWRDDISASLPPELDDEPADLRRDILDELSDHLQCAMQRELRRTDDEPAARGAVLHRFGDPVRLARRLWFDAMKESIMNQRITLITNVIVAAACVMLCLITFNAMRQNAQVNDALLGKLESLSAPAPIATSEVWSELIVRIESDRDAPGSISDLRASLRGDLFNPGRTDSLTSAIGDDGTVHFGPVRPGRYTLRVYGEFTPSYSDRITLYPGRDNRETIEWLDHQPILAAVRIVSDWAADLPEDEGPDYRLLTFDRVIPESLSEWTWRDLRVLIDRAGGMMPIDPFDPVISPRTNQQYELDPERLDFTDRIDVDATFSYVLSHVTEIGRLSPSPVQGSLRARGITVFSPNTRQPARARNQPGGRSFYRDLGAFTAAPGRDNVWLLTEDNEAVQAARGATP